MYENPCEVPWLWDFDKFGYNFFRPPVGVGAAKYLSASSSGPVSGAAEERR
ncbi:hypothetical protein BQ8794_50096 [Mesorhizobium prunaredense]|uniref:Uncharacterized protein n=1 Tax=Mesorhizobium prunaredense TaxID=1631249 RepID=A0A1R3VDQ8_9HYPH|nr:hypothetical protein BQ8794_50096 [Mesorhizobium prunaredense]